MLSIGANSITRHKSYSIKTCKFCRVFKTVKYCNSSKFCIGPTLYVARCSNLKQLDIAKLQIQTGVMFISYFSISKCRRRTDMSKRTAFRFIELDLGDELLQKPANKINEYHQQLACLLTRSLLVHFVSFNLNSTIDQQCRADYCFRKKIVRMLESLIS